MWVKKRALWVSDCSSEEWRTGDPDEFRNQRHYRASRYSELVCVCLCVCVYERERERERETDRQTETERKRERIPMDLSPSEIRLWQLFRASKRAEAMLSSHPHGQVGAQVAPEG